MGVIRPQPLRIPQQSDMITFFEDYEGNFVYYTSNPQNGTTYVLNGEIDFCIGETCTVPKPITLEEVRSRQQIAAYRNSKTEEMLRPNVYLKQVQALDKADPSLEEEVELTRLQREWDEVYEEVEVRDKIPFTIEKVEYIADERLKPLRHLGNPSQINYFSVDGEAICFAYAHKLCREAGLERVLDNHRRHTKRGERGTYYLDDDFYWWQIEGNNYGDRSDQRELQENFVGPALKCYERIQFIEDKVQEMFDSWAIALIEPPHATVKHLSERINNAQDYMKQVDPKIKTKGYYKKAMDELDGLVDYLVKRTQEKHASNS